jgi:hypothetical protein
MPSIPLDLRLPFKGGKLPFSRNQPPDQAEGIFPLNNGSKAKTFEPTSTIYCCWAILLHLKLKDPAFALIAMPEIEIQQQAKYLRRWTGCDMQMEDKRIFFTGDCRCNADSWRLDLRVFLIDSAIEFPRQSGSSE